MARRRPKTGNRRRSGLLGKPSIFLLGGLALALVYFGAVFLLRNSEGSREPAGVPSQQVADPISRWDGLLQQAIQQTRHFRGDPNAPVTILEFSDFQ